MCKRCKLFFIKIENVSKNKDNNNANKLDALIKNTNNIRKRKDNSLACIRCNITAGKATDNKFWYLFDSSKLIEIIKIGNEK